MMHPYKHPASNALKEAVGTWERLVTRNYRMDDWYTQPEHRRTNRLMSFTLNARVYKDRGGKWKAEVWADEVPEKAKSEAPGYDEKVIEWKAKEQVSIETKWMGYWWHAQNFVNQGLTVLLESYPGDEA